MVDPIGIKPRAVNDRRTAPVAVATQAPAPRNVTAEEGAVAQTASTELSRSMASQAPVDSERVARIRKAVQEGRFPLVPSTVADRLLALKLEWNPNNDPA